jgi:hypothetical protein
VEVSKVDDTIKELNDYLCDKKNWQDMTI